MKTKNRIGFAVMIDFAVIFLLLAALDHGVTQELPRPPRTCWCCIPGQSIAAGPVPGRVIQTSVTECRQKGGHCYGSREEASRYCGNSLAPPPRTCWCCISVECLKAPCPERVVQTTVTECRQKGGHCYGSREEASRYCGNSLTPPPGRR
jgi:hypothetical protein